MYYHTATCNRCGREFTVEVRAGEPRNRRGECKACKRKRAWIGLAIAFPVIVVVVAIANNCGRPNGNARIHLRRLRGAVHRSGQDRDAVVPPRRLQALSKTEPNPIHAQVCRLGFSPCAPDDRDSHSGDSVRVEQLSAPSFAASALNAAPSIAGVVRRLRTV